MKQDNKPFVENENIIDLTPSVTVDTTNQEATDNPIIIIETDDHGAKGTGVEKPVQRKWWQKKRYVTAIVIAVLLALAACAYAGWLYYRHNYYVGMPVSTTVDENIAKLQTPQTKVPPQVIFTHDSVGSVVLNLYELRGLKADLTFDEPDSTDTSVYLYSRCADYDKNGHILGSMVIDGKPISNGNMRLGYCAMLGDNTVIGVDRNEGVRDYVEENGGSFFRQFILVSAGEIPTVFHLHKKMERRALARMSYTNQLYYIESCNTETMYDFADAIRKYGFIDAIYITGGKCHSYYRTADGKCHDIGLPAPSRPRRIPWIVFRKR